MPTYYAFVPDHSEFPTAEVNAPDARHSRTAYLDYLTRNGIIDYSVRGAARKVIKVTKMEPGSIQTSIQLDYGVGNVPTQELTTPSTEPRSTTTTTVTTTPQDQYEQTVPQNEYEQTVSVQPQRSKSYFGNSRLSRLVRGSGGL